MLALYKNIKNRRKELGMNQETLAKKVGYSGKSMVSKVERGEIDLSETMIKKFANALQISASDLMGWDDIESKAELAADIYFNDDNITSLIEIYNKLNDNRKDDLFVYANFLLSKQRED